MAKISGWTQRTIDSERTVWSNDRNPWLTITVVKEENNFFQDWMVVRNEFDPSISIPNQSMRVVRKGVPTRDEAHKIAVSYMRRNKR